MSMISAQCDVLRDAADELARVTNGIRSGVPASTWHGMTYVFDNAAHWLRQAADTILELRCKLVDQSEEIKRLESENAKLRELVAHYEYAVTVYDVKPVEVLEWSTRCGALRKELGIEDEDA